MTRTRRTTNADFDDLARADHAAREPCEDARPPGRAKLIANAKKVLDEYAVRGEARSAPAAPAHAQEDAWLKGFAVALAEVHRQLIDNGEDTSLCRVATGAGLTLREARRVGVDPYDIKRLRKAGIR